MRTGRRLLTLDSNVFIAALKVDDPYSQECSKIVDGVADSFLLSEPSIVYQEVCGTLARRVGREVADAARDHLDRMIHPRLLADCGRAFCAAAYPLCSELNIYAVDALYLKVAIDSQAILVSLDGEDFIDRVNRGGLDVEAHHVSEFPY